MVVFGNHLHLRLVANCFTTTASSSYNFYCIQLTISYISNTMAVFCHFCEYPYGHYTSFEKHDLHCEFVVCGGCKAELEENGLIFGTAIICPICDVDVEDDDWIEV
jgi:hypothetical protein